MSNKKIIKAFQAKTKPFIYYDDNGSWTIYKSKAAYDKIIKLNDDERWDEADNLQEKSIIAEGYDGDGYGYVPTLVEILAETLGVEYDSI